MEPYFLTEEDIRNFKLKGAMVGEQATDADLEAMGMMDVEAAPAVIPSQASQDYTAARAQGVEPENAPQSGGIPVTAPTPSPAMGAGTAGANPMMGLLALSTPIPQDPFENLSRSQRTMIGFAALKDAGMALQGKEGNAVSGVMKDITNRADMERKRQAAVARQQMMGSVFGGGGGGVAMQGGDIEARKQQIINGMGLGIIEPTTGNAMLAELNRQLDQQKSTEGVVAGAAGALDDVDRMREILKEGGATGLGGFLMSFLPTSKATAARDLAATLRSGMALGALSALKAGGATLGSVSEKELELLESSIAKLNLNSDRKTVEKQLATIEGHYKNAVRLAYGKANQQEKEAFNAHFGGTPSWVLEPFAGTPAASGTTMDDLTDEEKKRLGIQ